jgi:hypothetical protein
MKFKCDIHGEFEIPRKEAYIHHQRRDPRTGDLCNAMAGTCPKCNRSCFDITLIGEKFDTNGYKKPRHAGIRIDKNGD